MKTLTHTLTLLDAGARSFLRKSSLLLLLAAAPAAQAGSAMWNLDPTNNDWATAANWTPTIVPMTPSDVATFGPSNILGVSISRLTNIHVSEINFNPDAGAYTMTVNPAHFLYLDGAGVANASAVEQNFVAASVAGMNGAGTISFTGAANAGTGTHYTCLPVATVALGGQIFFHDQTSANTGTFTVSGGASVSGAGNGYLEFSGAATADHATIVNTPGTTSQSGGGITLFIDNATAADAVITNTGGTIYTSGSTRFVGTSSAGQATITGYPSNLVEGGYILFDDTSTADHASFTNYGTSAATGHGSRVYFNTSSKAGYGTFTNYGAVGSTNYHASGRTELHATTRAQSGTFIAHGGTNGGLGAVIAFAEDSDGGRAQIILDGNGNLDISQHNAPGVTVGSIAGSGIVFLGNRQLAIGNGSRGDAFDGIIQDGGEYGGAGGSLVKVGTGVLTLNGANTYTGGTIIETGTLVLGSSGASFGTGPVQVQGGVLGGGGVITGAVTVASGATITPGVRTDKRRALQVKAPLTFEPNSGFVSRIFPTSALADQITANGITIESGAVFAFGAGASGAIPAGTEIYLLRNTSAAPIAGVFANLPDGAIVTDAGSNFQVNYEGGDGNDLTLTVVQ